MAGTPAYRRLPVAERREAILGAATALIAAAGYTGVSLEAFASAAGMTGPGLLHHFPTKEHLLVAVLERRDRLDAEASAGEAWPGTTVTDPAGARTVADQLVERNLGQREVIRLYAVLSAESLVPTHPAHEYFQRRLDDARRGLATHLLSWHPDPDAAAVELLSFLDGLQLNWLRDPDIDFRAVWRSFADRFFVA